jgi:hypothetical protein
MKNIKISDEVHNAIKKHCDENGLKISVFVDRLCLKWVREHAESSDREIESGSDGQKISQKGSGMHV